MLEAHKTVKVAPNMTHKMIAQNMTHNTSHSHVIDHDEVKNNSRMKIDYLKKLNPYLVPKK